MSNIISDAEVEQMHPRQAQILRTIPAADRAVVLRSAHLMQNMTGGNLSGALWSSASEYRRIGAAALARKDRITNARAMGWTVDEDGHRIR